MPATDDTAPLPPEFLPLPAGTPLPERDRHWYATMYQGDAVPQLTLRAVVTGALVGMVLSVSNLYMVLKTGLSFGVAITACVLSYTLWNVLHRASGRRLGQPSLLENNCMQSTASAAGFSTGNMVSVTFAALMMLDPEHRQQPWWVIAGFTFTAAAMGVFMAVPMKRLYINDAQLPFPSGTAAAVTLRGLHGRSAESVRQAYALCAGMVAGVAVGVLTTAENQFAALGRFFDWMRLHLVDIHLPDKIPSGGFAQLDGKRLSGFYFEPGLAIVGAGMLVSRRVSLSMLAGSAALYLWITPALHALDVASAGTAGYVASIPASGGGTVFNPLRWAVWGGASLLVFSSVTALAMQWQTVARALRALGRIARTGTEDRLAQRMAAIEVPRTWMLAGMFPLALAMIIIQVLAFGVSWWVGAIAVAMCFLLSLVVSRAMGETDIAPEGPIGKIMQLFFALVAGPGAMGTQASLMGNVMSAGMAATSASASSDLLTDLKAGYLVGANPRRQFLAQLAGVFFGTLACVPAWYLLVPDIAALEKFPAPAAHVWVTMAHALTGGLENLPLSIRYAILIGAAAGILMPVLEAQLPRTKDYLPSAMGVGLGWVVPFSVVLSLAIGSTLAGIWRRWARPSEEAFRLPLAAGLIAGDSVIQATLAMLATGLGLLH